MQSSFWLITSISTTQIYALPTGDCRSNSTKERRGERAVCIFRWKDFSLSCFLTVRHWNVQGDGHVWHRYNSFSIRRNLIALMLQALNRQELHRLVEKQVNWKNSLLCPKCKMVGDCYCCTWLVFTFILTTQIPDFHREYWHAFQKKKKNTFILKGLHSP